MNVLDRAGARLTLGGWRQGDLGTAYGPACMVGAVFFECVPLTAAWQVEQYRTALEAVRTVLGLTLGEGPDLLDWNDKPGRTIREVLEALQLASKELSK